jgi:hypothetical protein
MATVTEATNDQPCVNSTDEPGALQPLVGRQIDPADRRHRFAFGAIAGDQTEHGSVERYVFSDTVDGSGLMGSKATTSALLAAGLDVVPLPQAPPRPWARRRDAVQPAPSGGHNNDRQWRPSQDGVRAIGQLGRHHPRHRDAGTYRVRSRGGRTARAALRRGMKRCSYGPEAGGYRKKAQRRIALGHDVSPYVVNWTRRRSQSASRASSTSRAATASMVGTASSKEGGQGPSARR